MCVVPHTAPNLGLGACELSHVLIPIPEQHHRERTVRAQGIVFTLKTFREPARHAPVLVEQLLPDVMHTFQESGRPLSCASTKVRGQIKMLAVNVPVLIAGPAELRMRPTSPLPLGPAKRTTPIAVATPVPQNAARLGVVGILM